MENFSLLPKLPELINPAVLARDAAVLHGHYIADKLTNLSYGKVIGAPCIKCNIQVQQDSEGQIRMGAELNANLDLVCQNCFEPLQFELAVKFHAVLLLESQVMASKEFEVVLLRDDGLLALQETLDEEIILQLPLSPRHNKCFLTEDKELGINTEVVNNKATGCYKPFADLNKLLDKH